MTEAEAEPPGATRTAPTELGQALLDGFGGRRGMIDSALPTVVFAIVNVATGLRPAVTAAVVTGLAVAALRLARRQSVRQALSGLIGLAVAAVIALRTGHATGFYLPGILLAFAYAAVFVGSLLVRRPLVGVVLGLVSADYVGWRESRPLRRAVTIATAAWGGFYLLKGLVQGALYLSGHATGLAVLRLALGWPPLLLLVALTVALARAAVRVDKAEGETAAQTRR